MGIQFIKPTSVDYVPLSSLLHSTSVECNIASEVSISLAVILNFVVWFKIKYSYSILLHSTSLDSFPLSSLLDLTRVKGCDFCRCTYTCTAQFTLLQFAYKQKETCLYYVDTCANQSIADLQ